MKLVKKVKFVIDTGYVGCKHEVTDEFPDDITDYELEVYARDLVWEYINVCYNEVSE